MTEITVQEYYDRHLFIAQGHAGFCKKGEDIVCAAVSALSFTLLEAVRRAEEEQRLKIVREVVNDGYMCIEAQSFSFAQERVDEIFDTVTVGLLMLAEKYPEYVSVN